MNNITRLAGALQTILGSALDDIGRRTGVIKRRRKFSGSSLLKTIVLTLLKSPEPTLDDFAITAAQLGVIVTPQAIRRRSSNALIVFLRAALEHALEHMAAPNPVAIELFKKFTAVEIGDSTTVTLPEEFADEFPGCGGRGGQGKAAIKIQLRYEMQCGKMTRLFVTPGRHSDAKSEPQETPVKPGTLNVYDLGYFSVKRFLSVGLQKGYWLSRWFQDTKAYDLDGRPLNLLELMRMHSGGSPVDMPILMGSERLPCRLIALPVMQEIASRRRQSAYKQAQKHGRMPSQKQLDMCEWTIYVTNCPPELLTWKEVVILYRARWQIELLFKLWKSHNRLASSRATWSPVEHMVRFWGKLLGVVLQHAILIGTIWQDARRSLWKAARAMRQWIVALTMDLDDFNQLVNTLETIAKTFEVLLRQKSQHKDPRLFQLLMKPELLDWCP